jgi:hypothetical protein
MYCVHVEASVNANQSLRTTKLSQLAIENTYETSGWSKMQPSASRIQTVPEMKGTFKMDEQSAGRNTLICATSLRYMNLHLGLVFWQNCIAGDVFWFVATHWHFYFCSS